MRASFESPTHGHVSVSAIYEPPERDVGITTHQWFIESATNEAAEEIDLNGSDHVRATAALDEALASAIEESWGDR